jgi:hypothetical protein
MAVNSPEEYEPIIRRIMELEERIRERERTIEYFESILALRREETGLSHAELFSVDRAYRGTAYAIRALRGWNTRDRRTIEELKKLMPPLKALRMIMTFSIETGAGHETFYAEVTAETVMAADLTVERRREVSDRLMNAAMKLFWIIFDADKAVEQEKKLLWGQETYEMLRDRKNFFQKKVTVRIKPEDIAKYDEILKAYPLSAREYAMDNFIKALKQLDCFEEREPDQFVTRQAIIKIGVEYEYAAEEAEPKYPLVYLLIEKGTGAEKKHDWVLCAKIEIADETDINMMKLLDMKYEK